MTNFNHQSVLSRELIAGLEIVPHGKYLDATVGGGGHSQALLDTGKAIKIVAIDRDEIAVAAAKNRLSHYYPQQLEFWQGNFADYQPEDLSFDGIFADLGVSSPQLDVPQRGFSFRHSAPLDMRMDRSQTLSAAEIVNHWTEVALADLIYQYGEERFSRRIAKRIVSTRPFQTTTELAAAIAYAVPSKYRYGRIHPATRTFQALRIEVNQELQSLERLLDKAQTWLKPGGIIGIISFHSLEDRIVKHGYRERELFQVLTKKPIVAGDEERKLNPRARSAKLRFARRISSS
ncbi:16S rRNA (cytosine(1402)-N(4))-methyltransferase RsmH [Myxosarcina sp. GI1(2024)]